MFNLAKTIENNVFRKNKKKSILTPLPDILLKKVSAVVYAAVFSSFLNLPPKPPTMTLQKKNACSKR